jgi:hypothetical protein
MDNVFNLFRLFAIYIAPLSPILFQPILSYVRLMSFLAIMIAPYSHISQLSIFI